MSTLGTSALAAAVPEGDADERAVRSALAVPTRAAIYRVLRTEGRPHSAREIGVRIGIHANVARGHLDVLVDAGLATAGSRHNPTGGRPAKVYVAREQLVPSSGRAPTVPSGAVLGLQTALQLIAGLREHVARPLAGALARLLSPPEFAKMILLVALPLQVVQQELGKVFLLLDQIPPDGLLPERAPGPHRVAHELDALMLDVAVVNDNPVGNK